MFEIDQFSLIADQIEKWKFSFFAKVYNFCLQPLRSIVDVVAKFSTKASKRSQHTVQTPQSDLRNLPSTFSSFIRMSESQINWYVLIYPAIAIPIAILGIFRWRMFRKRQLAQIQQIQQTSAANGNNGLSAQVIILIN